MGSFHTKRHPRCRHKRFPWALWSQEPLCTLSPCCRARHSSRLRLAIACTSGGRPSGLRANTEARLPAQVPCRAGGHGRTAQHRCHRLCGRSRGRCFLSGERSYIPGLHLELDRSSGWEGARQVCARVPVVQKTGWALCGSAVGHRELRDEVILQQEALGSFWAITHQVRRQHRDARTPGLRVPGTERGRAASSLFLK